MSRPDGLSSGRPLGLAESAALLDPWIGPGAAYRGAVLAVSGGPDSTALMGCAALAGRGVPVIVATVDHGLRPASTAEADGVAGLAARLGLRHRVLAWTGPKPAARLQEVARAARYRLLADLAREAGADLVLTAHTLDDQAETVLMRLCAGSGPAGLAGMAPARALGGLTLGRPFLSVPKARLVATCEARGWPFVRDPSNTDPRFGRARLRRLLPLLAEEGLSADRLVRLAGRLRRDEAALSEAAEAALRDLRRPEPDGEGRLVLDGLGLAALPEAVALRVVVLAVGAVQGAAARGEASHYPARLDRLERTALGEILPALREGKACRRTVAGLLLAAGGGRLTLGPEPPRRPRTPRPE
ncbi:tRNA lysidine(34) synthetase TilS [Methylobacterium frigidaeris]|uniref:tRNA(Ile)-lysidine synthase n=1 Tax=Methylobacterium frigidaeris TaxID=2038277 RepID=A0AA37M5U6_9HYPH|nr:tRNA lysidine(34) synthetase TilS [Methylobacterium frigidaeris]PIK72350.1 tRNA lysidine(34) synthetase TilS [Methylobacterium frigidaeris]GJD63832.1 tRNA(Ile)-lysidine synthase [Methylobacterium frigidaeris]